MNTDEYTIDDCGVVYRKTNGSYSVHMNGAVLECSLSSKLLKEKSGQRPGNAFSHGKKKDRDEGHLDPVVGDRVRLARQNGTTGSIVEVLPRRNQLARRSALPMPGAHAFEQVIAANVDQVVPVFAAANPDPKWNMLDRYLVMVEALELPVLICITKLDLVQSNRAEEELQVAVEEYRAIGYPLLLTSSYTGQGIDSLIQALQDRFTVFLGKSGVGKTALLNALQPGLGLRVNEVSRATGKGKHTTTHMEMFPLDGHASVMDTPGVREFGLWGIEGKDLAFYFPEMRPFLGRCKFGLDCQHDEEPGCAIRRAVMSGSISPRRYHSYMRLKEELS